MSEDKTKARAHVRAVEVLDAWQRHRGAELLKLVQPGYIKKFGRTSALNIIRQVCLKHTLTDFTVEIHDVEIPKNLQVRFSKLQETCNFDFWEVHAHCIFLDKPSVTYECMIRFMLIYEDDDYYFNTTSLLKDASELLRAHCSTL